MFKTIKILKQENLEKIIYFNTIKKLFVNSLKGNGLLDFSKIHKITLFKIKNKTKLKVFVSNKTEVNFYINSFDSLLKGIAKGFFFELSVRGIGYKCLFISENKIFLNLGFSHYIIYTVPKNVIIFLKKGKIYVYSLSKEMLGCVIKELKNMRIPDAYKAKGIVEANKMFNLKEGKKR